MVQPAKYNRISKTVLNQASNQSKPISKSPGETNQGGSSLGIAEGMHFWTPTLRAGIIPPSLPPSTWWLQIPEPDALVTTNEGRLYALA